MKQCPRPLSGVALHRDSRNKRAIETASARLICFRLCCLAKKVKCAWCYSFNDTDKASLTNFNLGKEQEYLIRKDEKETEERYEKEKWAKPDNQSVTRLQMNGCGYYSGTGNNHYR